MMNLYQFSNYAEGALWLVAAVVLRKLVVIKEKRHSIACNIAIVGFLLFSASDFIEGSLTREFHPWLWVLKIGCCVIFLIARIIYVGKKNFKWTDRYFLFFIFCLSIATGILCIASSS